MWSWNKKLGEPVEIRGMILWIAVGAAVLGLTWAIAGCPAACAARELSVQRFCIAFAQTSIALRIPPMGEHAEQKPPAPPSVSQRQADAMEHAAHNAEYAAEKKIPMHVGAEFHGANIREGLWGKAKGKPCVKCEEAKNDPPPEDA